MGGANMQGPTCPSGLSNIAQGHIDVDEQSRGSKHRSFDWRTTLLENLQFIPHFYGDWLQRVDPHRIGGECASSAVFGHFPFHPMNLLTFPCNSRNSITHWKHGLWCSAQSKEIKSKPDLLQAIGRAAERGRTSITAMTVLVLLTCSHHRATNSKPQSLWFRAFWGPYRWVLE